jgi:hypothetical protein
MIIFYGSDKTSIYEMISLTDIVGHLPPLEVLELISLANRHAFHITKALLLNVGFVLMKLKTVLSDAFFGARVISMRTGVHFVM